ncbi:hypothetical protein GCM10018781_02260 [Kitasatospora indigofera]|uniref:Uncharacterized protein n=1 Tax=Kitasatospora indigofera TaxID=67307 RepID=A0A919FB24_9ACTN|nr:hypothetical protein GCM10018781_02260 [Kitasatospora indigofera]
MTGAGGVAQQGGGTVADTCRATSRRSQSRHSRRSAGSVTPPVRCSSCQGGALWCVAVDAADLDRPARRRSGCIPLFADRAVLPGEAVSLTRGGADRFRAAEKRVADRVLVMQTAGST